MKHGTPISIILAALLVTSLGYFAYPYFEERQGERSYPELQELNDCVFRPSPEFTHCSLDEFSFSDSYYEIVPAGTVDQLCDSERRIERIAGVVFILSPKPDPGRVHCGFSLTIQYREGDSFFGRKGEIFFGGATLKGGPRPSEIHRYILLLTNPGSNSPIAGIVYDHEALEVYYMVTVMTWIGSDAESELSPSNRSPSLRSRLLHN